MSVGAVSGGLFGKLPAHGDFVARGDPAIVDWFERWLTTELAALAVAHSDALDPAMAHAPVWRFTLDHDGVSIAGALLPSTDRVGRLFPLVVFAGSEAGTAPADADALAAMPLDRSMTADDVMIAIAATTGEASIPPESGRWRSDAGDDLAIEGLPARENFARLFGLVDPTP